MRNLCEKFFLSTGSLCGNFLIKNKYSKSLPFPNRIHHLPTLPSSRVLQQDLILHNVRFPCDVRPSLLKKFSAHPSHPIFQSKLWSKLTPAGTKWNHADRLQTLNQKHKTHLTHFPGSLSPFCSLFSKTEGGNPTVCSCYLPFPFPLLHWGQETKQLEGVLVPHLQMHHEAAWGRVSLHGSSMVTLPWCSSRMSRTHHSSHCRSSERDKSIIKWKLSHNT